MNCEKCSEKFSEKSDPLIPRILTNCGHTICHQCCENLLKNGQISCPIDGKITEISVSGLPKNLAILKILKDFEDGKYVEASSGNQNPENIGNSGAHESTSTVSMMPTQASESVSSIHSEDLYPNQNQDSNVKLEYKLNLIASDSGIVGNYGVQVLGAQIEDVDVKWFINIKPKEERASGAQNQIPQIQNFNFVMPFQQTQISNHRMTPEVQNWERRQNQGIQNHNQNQMTFSEGFMECKICLRKFSGKVANRTPRILTDCGHTICHYCCVRIEDGGWITCPFDREQTELYDCTVTSLQKNYYILEMLEILKDVFPDSEEPDDARFDIEEGMHTAHSAEDSLDDSEDFGDSDEDVDGPPPSPRSHYASSMLSESEYY